ncbi:MAG: winged helix-turn-helix domain-containing protein [Terriglobia bacterium]|nr:winged helix-turn-helix domain-containing protein [Terriglobia bacterium]
MQSPAEVPAAAFVDGEFVIGEWLIQPSLGLLSRGDNHFHLEPKTMLVLVCLARHAGTTVSKQQLLQEVWPETFITEHVLTHAIWQLRHIFRDEQVIQTVPRRGYRLALDVRPAVTNIRSLAVLPLANLTGDPEQQYFADGTTEALITRLAQIGALRVISRTTAMKYKDTALSLPEVAAALKVEGVVEGSVMRDRERVRISVQLIHAATDQHLWARSYDRCLRDVLTLQDEVARAIAAEIQVTLTDKERAQLTRSRSVNPEAHEAYLKGRFCHARTSENGLRMAIAYMQEAIATDSTYALAYTGLADAIALLASPVAEAIAPAEANKIMQPAVQKALELDPDLPEAHFLSGWIKVYYEWDWQGAEAAFQHALSLSPNYAMGYDGLGTVYEALGSQERAIAAWKRSCELDPLSLLSNVLLGWTLVLAGRATAAVEQLRQTLLMDPNYWFAREVLALALVMENRFDEAVIEAETAVRLAPEPFPKGVLGNVYARAGRRSDALEVLRELELLSADRYIAPNLLGFILAGLGQMERAFHLLERAYEVRDASLIWLKSFEVLWGRSLRGHPRYEALLARMNLK